MVLRDVAVHAQNEEPSALLTVIRKTERLTEEDTASTHRLELASRPSRLTNGVEHIIHSGIDCVGETGAVSDIEEVHGAGAIRSITEDSVLGFSSQYLSLTDGGSFVEVKALVVEEEVCFSSTRVEHRTFAFAEFQQWKWATEASTELVQAQFALRRVEIIVLEVGSVETFVTVLPESAAVIVVRSASRLDLDTNGAITGTLGTGGRSCNSHLVDRVDAGTNEGEESV